MKLRRKFLKHLSLKCIFEQAKEDEGNKSKILDSNKPKQASRRSVLYDIDKNTFANTPSKPNFPELPLPDYTLHTEPAHGWLGVLQHFLSSNIRSINPRPSV